MAQKAASCTKCGAAIQLDDSLEKGYCSYCGSEIIVNDAIAKIKIEHSGKVTMSGISSADNDVIRGSQCVAACDWQKAFKYFSDAIDKEADHFDAWFGCLVSMTHDFFTISYDWVSLDGVTGMKSVIKHSIKYAKGKKKKELVERLTKFVDLLESQEDINFNNLKNIHINKVAKYKKQIKSSRISAVVIFAFVLLLFFVSRSTAVLVIGLIVAILLSRSVIKSTKRSEPPYIPDVNFMDLQARRYIQEIRDVIKGEIV